MPTRDNFAIMAGQRNDLVCSDWSVPPNDDSDPNSQSYANSCWYISSVGSR